MLQRVDMLGYAGRGRSAKMKREELHLGRLVTLDYINQFKRDRSGGALLDRKLAVQLLAENLGVQIVQRRRHMGTHSLSNIVRQCQLLTIHRVISSARDLVIVAKAFLGLVLASPAKR